MFTRAGSGASATGSVGAKRGTWQRLGVATAMIVTVATATSAAQLATGSVAQAANDLTLSVSAPGEQLLTDPAVIPVTMTATNPAGGDGLSGFNGSFTAILPVGATFDSGSIAPASMSTLGDGRTALFFENVGDIQDGSVLSLDFSISVPAADFPVGSTVAVEGHFGANTDPRTVPNFDPATGTFSGDTSGATPTGTSSTLLTPLEIEKTNLTAISTEMVRGVHDHVATYQLLVTNNGVADDDAVIVDDFVPDLVEFLGCGGVDNTTDATGTNPGSPLEYATAAALTSTAAPAGSCPLPVLVETVTVTAGVITSGTATNGTNAPASVADGVYTHVRWDLGTLTPANYAAPFEIHYQVGIPLRRNVYVAALNDDTGTDPTANLDNNTGSYTTEDDGSELVQRNYASVQGAYTGPVAPGFDPVADTFDDDDDPITVEDLAIQKSVSVPDPLVQGAVVRYDLNIQTSEYRTITDAVITDTLSDGQCPLLTGGVDPEASPQSGECALAGNDPTFPFATVTEATDGSFELVWNSSTAPFLAGLAPSTVTSLSFYATVRGSYQEDFLDQAPFNGTDRLNNEVEIEGTTNLVAGIPDDPTINLTPIQDTGSASYQSGTAGIDKSISLPVAPGSTLDCNSATWVRTNPPPPVVGDPYAYRIGDRVCFRLGVDFIGDLNFRNARVDDFLPAGMAFEQVWQTPGALSGSSAADGDPTGATAANGVIIDSIEVVPGTDGDLVTWDLGTLDPDTVGSPFEDDLFVSNGGVRFEVILSATVTDAPADRTAADIKANLQKFTTSNLDNQSVSRRDQADFQVVQPNLRASKTAVPTIAVQGQPISYTASVTNIFSDASESTAAYDPAYARAINVASWDLLPPSIACADVSTIALDRPGSFTCIDGLSGGRNGIVFTVDELDPQETANLTYTVTIPTGTPAGAVLTNDIGVRQYGGTPTNDGDPSNDPLFVPTGNIDPSLELQANMPPADADATVTTPAPVVTKEQQSSLTDPGNVSNSGFAVTTDEATIGETVQYRVSTVVAGGTTVFNSVLADTVPAGLRIVGIDSVELFDAGPGTTTDISGGALGFGFVSDATSWTVTFPAQYDNVSGTGDDTITVVYTVVVEDVVSNSAGTDLDNIGRLTFDNALVGGTTVDGDSDPVTLHLVEPNPQVAKDNDSTDPATPGAEITYTLTVTNPATADISSAYDVEIVDTVPIGVTPLDAPAGALMVADGPVTGPSGSIGNWNMAARTITWTQTGAAGLAQVDPGATVTLDYATQLSFAVPGETLVNTADLSATSAPGANADERTSYVAQSQSSVETLLPSVLKEQQSSLTDPGNLSNAGLTTTLDEATIGETVQYRSSALLSVGATVYNGSFADTLPAGMRIVSIDSVELFDAGPPATTTDLTVGALGFGVASDATGWSITFPAQYDNASGTGDDTITVVYTAIVEDVPGNVAGTDLDNISQLTYDNAEVGGTPTSVDSDPVTVHLVEPNPLVAKSNNATDPSTPGGEITYTLTVTNPVATDTSSAYDVEIVDDVPLGITPLDSPAGTLMTADGTVTGPSGSIGLWDATLRTITWTQVEVATLAQVDPGASITLDYAALLTIPAVADLVLVNTVDLTATSTPAGNPDERDTYASQSTSTVVPPAATVDKSIPSAQITYAVGEIVDFEVSFTFPAGTVGFDTTVFDQIPDELTFDSFGTPTFSGPECQIFDPVGNVGIGAFTAGDVISFGPGVGGDSQRIAWFFDELAADPAAVLADCTVTLPYAAHVDTDGVDGSTFSNSVDLRWNAQDDIAANPVDLPAGFDDPAGTDWDRGDGPASVTIDVAEPQLDVDIDTLAPASALAGFTNDQTPGNDTAASDDPDGTAATAPGGIDGDGGDVAPGEEISQRVTVTNNGNADAFDTTVVVTVGPGVTPLDAPAGTPLAAAGAVTGPGGEIGQWDPTTRTITYLPADNPNLAAAITPDGSVTLAYDVVLDDSDSLADLQDITDSVDVPTYYGVPPLEQGQPDVPTYGNDAAATRGAVDPDETTIEVHFPELAVDKTAISDATDVRFDSPFTFQFVITNTDAVATAFDVDATDTLPAGWNYVANSATVTSPANAGVPIEPTGVPGGPLVWTDIDTLLAGETITIVYAAQPDSTVLAPDKATGIANTGLFAHTNSVDVVADDATGSPTYDGGTAIAATDDQDVFIRRVDLSVTKAISSPSPLPAPPSGIYFGAFVEYEITVTNDGPDDATGVELTDDNLANTGLPNDTILFVGVVSADRGTYDGATGVWTVGNVAAGETLSLVVRTQINTVDPPAPAVNEVEVSAADQFDADSDPDNLVSGNPSEDDEAAVSISPLPTTLGNFIWLDLDGDGVQDVAEPGIPGVQVVLNWTEPGGQARQVTVTTDAGGAYNVPPSFVDEVIGGTTSLPQNVDITVTVLTASPNLTGLTPVDGPESDVDGGLPNVSMVQIDATAVILPDGSAARLDVDFGYQPQPQSLGDRLWWDQDVSGDPSDGTGEYGIGGATVDITWYGFDGLLGTADDLTFQTVTSDGTIDVDGVGGLDPAGTWSSFYDPATGLADRNIPPGLYDVSVDLATLPSGLTVDTFDLDGNLSNGGLTATGITLLLNDQRTDVDFSIAGMGVIGDTVWFDHDGDGAQAAGEPGISGVEVQLTWAGPNGTFGDADDAVLTTTTSDGTTDVDGDLVVDPAGTYVFSNLPDGNFDLVVDPTGTSLPDDLTQTGDPDTALDGTSQVTLDSSVGNTVDLDQDFGYQGDLSIGDLVFYDVDGNGTGVIDGPDVSLAGVDVTVTWAGNDGVFGTPDDFATTVTTSDGTIDPLGTYQVDGLPSGDYQVEINPLKLPAGVRTPTYDDDETGAPDVITTPDTSLTTLAGGDDLDQDFSYTGVGAVGDTVWWDKNEDGVQDLDEPGMPGLAVTLTSPGFDGIPGTDDDLLVTTITSDGTTDVDGDSVIDPPGSYWIPNLPLDVPLTVTVDDTDLATMPATHDRDDTADDSIAVGTPNSATLTLSAAAPTADDVDFGYSGAGAVGDIVWLDLGSDGVQDPGEPGLAGVTIEVSFPGADGILGTADDIVEITTTSDGTTDVDGDSVVDPAGSYYVDSLPLDTPIRVTVVTSGPDALPAELLPTGDADGSLTTPHVSEVTLDTTDPINRDQDFGYAGPGAVGDTIWYDVDGDGAADPAGQGVFDAPDVPMIGVAVTVTGSGLDGVLDTPDDFVIDFVTDDNGEYLAESLPYGEYRVEVDTASLLAGVTTQTFDPDPLMDATSTVTLSLGVPQNLDQDFSFTASGAVGDTVWFDQNGDGVQDPGEPGLVGIPITITSPGPDGLAGTADDLTISTTTSDGTIDVDGDLIPDPPGSYYVGNLPLDVPLTVTVTEGALPAGLLPIFDADGVATPHSSVLTLTGSTPIDVDQDFGYAGAGSLGDTVFFDRDGIDSGGLPDTAAGDAGITGVELTLTWTNPTGGPPLIITTTTGDGTTDVDGDSVIDPPGSYSFGNLPQGDYTVSITPASLPPGLAPVFDPEANADLMSAVTLTSAVPSDADRDFSFTGTGSIGDTVWFDSNADGAIGATETGVAGVTVTLEFSDPATGTTFMLTTTTDADGLYRFDNLPAGDYTVSYDPDSLPTGYGAVSDPDAVPDGSATLSLTDGEVRDDIDFGVRPMATIDGVIFDDLDGDGVQGPDEPGLAGVVIEITDSNGETVSVTTDADGRYVATDLLAGELTIDIDESSLPDGVQLTTGNDPQTVNTVPGETLTADPVGYAPLSFISGTIWYDVDAAGDRGNGEPGLAGVVVELLDRNGVVIATMPTDANGFYQFTNIPTGVYSVRVDSTTLPAGLDIATFDPDATLDGTHTVALTIGGAVDRDFGYTGGGSVSDVVWVDLDRDGVLDPDEIGVAGVTATLTWFGPDGVFGTDDDVVLTDTSDASGEFAFQNLPAGSYRIDIDTATIGESFELTAPASFTFVLDPGQNLALDNFPLVPPAIPTTGSPAILYSRLAALILVAGMLLLVTARFRRRLLA